MKITKDDYILRNFSKIQHKSWELYVITRLIHLLDDPEIEFVCQQLIRTPNGKRYLADLCFPSLGVYLEIDEFHHTSKENVISDKHRKMEIIDATSFEETRIKIFDDKNNLKKLNEINQEIDIFIEELKTRKEELKNAGKFIAWNYENKFSPEPYINKGYIEVKDNVTFLYHKDALRLFGYNGGHHQGALWKIKEINKEVWFPKLYKNNDWDNTLSDDSKKIEMKLIKGDSLKNYYKKENFYKKEHLPNIVFAHYSNLLGQTVYKFLGEFEISIKESSEFAVIYNRKNTRVELNYGLR